jgi:hypothetical protein
MSEGSRVHPKVGDLVTDSATRRVGVFMGTAGPYAMLRPEHGGKEWEAAPDALRLAPGPAYGREVSAHPRPADVRQLESAARLHAQDCAQCTPNARCPIGERLHAAITTANARPAK